MSLVHTLYDRIPVFGQNLVVSLYGLKLYHERYVHSDGDVHKLLDSQWYSTPQIEQTQLHSLKALLSHADDTVPYYRELFARAGIRPMELDKLADITRIPLLKKETLRSIPDALLSRRFRKRDLIALNTSGTSGTSLKVFVDIASRRKAYAFVSRYHRWANLINSRNNVTFGGRTIVPITSQSKVFWRYNAAMGNYLFSSYHMSDDNLPYYVEKIRAIRPQFIESYPSAAYVLAMFMKDNGIDGIHPKAILTSGETLFDYQRECIEEVFGCKVFDQYGCTEQALFVSQCEKGSYHVHPEYGLVEILDDDDKPVGPGQPGRVICTSFMNMAMPLIRYDLGDTAEWDDGRCECGRSFPIIKRICGRKDDYIVTPDSRKIGRLDPIFKGVNSIKLAQIVQKDLCNLELKIVPGSNFSDLDKRRVLNELHKRIGPLMRVEVSIVSEIPISKNGKFKAVVAMCH